MINSIYIIGSLRNPVIPQIANDISSLGIDVFADWFSSGPETDDYWQKYEKERGRSYEEALKGYMAEHIFSFDKHHLDRTDAAVLVNPAGKSAHLELGYTLGKGKPGYILFTEIPDRWDVMCLFATQIFFNKENLLDELRLVRSIPPFEKEWGYKLKYSVTNTATVKDNPPRRSSCF